MIVISLGEPVLGLFFPLPRAFYFIGRKQRDGITVKRHHPANGRQEIPLQFTLIWMAWIGKRLPDIVRKHRCVWIEQARDVKRKEPLNVIVSFLQPSVRFLDDLGECPAAMVTSLAQIETQNEVDPEIRTSW